MLEVKVEKLWGHERILHNVGGYCMKELTLNQGYQSSLHMHREKDETFYVAKGIIELELGCRDCKVNVLGPGEWANVPPKMWHRFRAISGKATVVEASTEHRDYDVYRKEESRTI